VTTSRSRRDAVRRQRPSSLIKSARTVRTLSHSTGERALHLAYGCDRGTAALDGPQYPIAELRAAAHGRGCTINDLLIAAVTAGRRDLLSERGECQEGLALRASVPLGAHGGGSKGGMFIATLPVGVPDDAERLRIITQATAGGKGRPDQGATGMSHCPRASLGWAWPGLSDQPPGTSTCT
jgi:hypothetical protein